MTNCFSRFANEIAPPPRKPKDYSKSKIYRIDGNGLTYVGSTVLPLGQRFSVHKSHLKRALAGCAHYCSSFETMYECDDAVMSLIENYPCESREQLEAREKEHIRKIDCVNYRMTGKWGCKEPTPLHKHILSVNSEFRAMKDAMYRSKMKDPDARKVRNEKARLRSKHLYMTDPEFAEATRKRCRKFREENAEKVREISRKSSLSYYYRNHEAILAKQRAKRAEKKRLLAITEAEA